MARQGRLFDALRSVPLASWSYELARCSVYVMSGGAVRERSIDEEGHIVNLFQGPSPDGRGAVYPGDRQIRRSEGITIQLHTLRIKEPGGGRIENVPTIAIWIPGSIAQDFLVQNQPLPVPQPD